MKVLYTAKATATGGRDGRARSSDGVLDVGLALPRELGGAGASGTNPEQLFAAGYAACFESAVRHAARTRKIQIHESSVATAVGIGPRDAGGFGLEVELRVSLAGIERAVAESLAKEAHEVICPYSNATRGNVNVTVIVE